MRRITRYMLVIGGFLVGYSLVQLLKGNTPVLVALFSVLVFFLVYLLVVRMWEIRKRGAGIMVFKKLGSFLTRIRTSIFSL